VNERSLEFARPREFRMSAANPVPDSALHAAADVDDGTELPTQVEGHVQVEQDSQVESFDFHDTIPAPPWLDEPGEALELPVFTGR
jgi:hypothetical protein